MAGGSGQSGGKSDSPAGPGKPGPDGRTPVAQLVEQRIPNPQVAGSSPSRRVEDEGDEAEQTTTLDRARFDDKEAAGGFGIYKFGRGYWVRVMTAIGMGVLFLATAGWAWQQLEALSLPTRAWQMTVEEPEGTAQPGDRATLYRVDSDQPVAIASGTVETYTASGTQAGTLVVQNVTVERGASVLDARRVEVRPAVAGADGQASLTGAAQRPMAIPVFERVYLQAGVALGIVLLGAILTYVLVARRPGSVDFLIATDEEMRKVNWSTRKIIINSTYVVIAATVLIAAYIFVFDILLKTVLFEPIIGQ